jgi:hypothetical protein
MAAAPARSEEGEVGPGHDSLPQPASPNGFELATTISHPGRPKRRMSSLNRVSGRSGSKAGRNRMDGLNRAS